MSRPVKEKSLSGVSSTGSGTPLETGGRITITLFVVSDSDVSGDTLDVSLEGTHDGENYVTLGTVSAGDFEDPDGNGSYAAFVQLHGYAIGKIRANITAYSTAGSVDAWVAASNNPPTSMDYRTTG